MLIEKGNEHPEEWQGHDKEIKVNLEEEKSELRKINRRLDKELPASNKKFAFTR